MGHLGHHHFGHFDHPKPTLDFKVISDPSVNIKKITDDYYRIDPRHTFPGPGPIKLDPQEGLLPFILTMPHQFNANLSNEEAKEASLEMYDSMIRQAEYQIDMLKAHVDSLNKQRERLKSNSQG